MYSVHTCTCNYVQAILLHVHVHMHTCTCTCTILNVYILLLLYLMNYSLLGLWLHPPVLSPSPSSTNDEKYYFITFILFWLLTDSSDSKLTTPITDLSKSLLQKLFKVLDNNLLCILVFLVAIFGKNHGL